MSKRKKTPSPYSFFHNYTYSKLFLLLLPLLIAVAVVTAAVFVYYPVNITVNLVEPPIRFQTVSGITTVLSDDTTTAVIDVVGGDVYSYVSVLPNLRILDFRNFDSSKPYDVSLRIESLDVDGSYVNSMNIWISSGSSTSTPIRIYNNDITTYETSTLTLAADSLGYIYSNATFRSLSTVTLILTFRYSLTGVEVEYLNSITLRIHM